MTVHNPTSSVQPRSRPNLIVKEVAGELLVYDEKSAKAFCLNESAAAIWGLCDGNTTIAEMTKKLASSSDGMIDGAFVTFALAGFDKSGLLEHASMTARPVAGVTRAELFARAGRVGLATAVAVPLITSIVAPTAAKAYGRGDAETGGDIIHDGNENNHSGNHDDRGGRKND